MAAAKEFADANFLETRSADRKSVLSARRHGSPAVGRGAEIQQRPFSVYRLSNTSSSRKPGIRTMLNFVSMSWAGRIRFTGDLGRARKFRDGPIPRVYKRPCFPALQEAETDILNKDRRAAAQILGGGRPGSKLTG